MTTIEELAEDIGQVMHTTARTPIAGLQKNRRH
jgi:hypothetical protein